MVRYKEEAAKYERMFVPCGLPCLLNLLQRLNLRHPLRGITAIIPLPHRLCRFVYRCLERLGKYNRGEAGLKARGRFFYDVQIPQFGAAHEFPASRKKEKRKERFNVVRVSDRKKI